MTAAKIMMKLKIWAIAGLLGMLCASPAAAQPEEPAAGDPTSEADAAAEAADAAAAKKKALEEAKTLFRQGNALRKAGDFQRALDYYVRSRTLVPSAPNTINAAICLGELGRADEALEMYEELLTEFGSDLRAGERKFIVKERKRLAFKVASIDVIANVKGSLVIDGRARGDLPLLSPVRVLPGKHSIVVIKDGYRSFESTISVKVGKRVSVRAELRPLAISGSIRIEEPDLNGADVFIDGARVGAVPWEGTLEPGRHIYFVRKDDVGSAPREVLVVKGQTVLASVEASELGPELRFEVSPVSALISLNDANVGAGTWLGRLPLGEHAMLVTAEGYHPHKQVLKVVAQMEGAVSVELRVDRDHPRWSTRQPGKFWFDAFGGVGIAPSLGSGAELSCDTNECADNPMALGFAVGARIGYEFPFRLSIEAAGGYASLSKTLSRTIDDQFDAGGTAVPSRYTLQDQLSLAGPFAGVGLGYRLPLVGPLELRGHALLGALFVSAKDEVSGTASSQGRTIDALIEGTGESISSVDLFVMPQIDLGLRFDAFSASVGLAAGVFALDGPPGKIGDLRVRGDSCVGAPTAIDCAPGESLISGELAYGPFLVLLPMASAGYSF